MVQLNYIIYLLIITVGFICGIIFKWSTKSMRPVIILLGITLVSESISKFLAITIHNNNYVYHFFHPIQLFVWGFFFYMNTKNIIFKTSLLILTAIFIIGSFLNSLYLQELTVFPGNFIKFQTLILLLWSGNLFIEYLDKPTAQNIFTDPVFLTTIAVIWFNLVSFSFFDFFNIFLIKKIPTDSIRAVHYFSNYLYYSLIAVAMIVKSKQILREQH